MAFAGFAIQAPRSILERFTTHVGGLGDLGGGGKRKAGGALQPRVDAREVVRGARLKGGARLRSEKSGMMVLRRCGRSSRKPGVSSRCVRTAHMRGF